VFKYNNGVRCTELNPIDGQVRWTKFENPRAAIFARDWKKNVFIRAGTQTWTGATFGDMPGPLVSRAPTSCYTERSIQLMASKWLLEESVFGRSSATTMVKGYGRFGWFRSDFRNCVALRRRLQLSNRKRGSANGAGSSENVQLVMWLHEAMGRWSYNPPVGAFDFPGCGWALAILCGQLWF